MKKEIPVFFAVDNGYAPFLAVALNSAVEHINNKNNYRITVLYQELSGENIERLKKFQRKNFLIDFVPIRLKAQLIADCQYNRFRDDCIIAIYYRLFIASMFEQYDKAVYLDSDIVLNADIAELFNADIGENLIGACHDTSINGIKEFIDYVENAVGVKFTEYINSGVMVMNLKKMRETRFEDRFLNLLDKYGFESVAPDQDYINAMCNGKIYYLDTAWDTMPAHENGKKEPKLIHYNLFSKPWKYSGVQYEEFFWHYANDSGFLKEISAAKKSFTLDDEKREKQCLNNMLGRAKEICNSEVTFKKMGEKGEKITV